MHANHIIERTARFGECCADVSETLMRLRDDVMLNGHCRIVETRGARYVDVVAVHDGAAVTGNRFKRRAG